MKKIISFIILIPLFLFGISLNVFSFLIDCDNNSYEILGIKNTQKTSLKYDKNIYAAFSASSSYIVQLRAYTTSYVYTPRGTAVEVFTRDEMSSDLMETCNKSGDSLVPEAKRIASSTTKYNCHSYAWYMQSTSNSYWMNNPASYYIDGSYEESTGNVGDIICYYDIKGFNLHSGIVIAKKEGVSNGICGDSNLVTVRSKWGAWGLYEHRGDQCPYTSSYNGEAAYVRYYKVHQHSYTYKQTSSGHTAICSDCGYMTELSHVYDQHYCIHCKAYTEMHDYDRNFEWVSYTIHSAECICSAITSQGHAVSSGAFNSGQRFATCLLCGGLAEMGFTQLNIKSFDFKVTFNRSFILPNGVIVLEDDDLEAYVNGTLIFYNINEVPQIQ